MKFILTSIFIFVYFYSRSQCNKCLENLNFLIDSVETNYVGFPSFLKSDGKSYKFFKKNIIEKAQKQEKINIECFRLLKTYIFNFRDPHLNIVFNFNTKLDSTFFQNDDYFNSLIKQNKIRGENYTLNEEETILGDWIEDTNNKLTLMKSSNNLILGKATSTDSVQIFKNQIRFILFKKNGIWQSIFQNKDHFVRDTREVKIYNGEILIDRFIRLFRDKNYFDEISKFEYKPINDSFSYLRVPDCLASSVKVLDSLLKKNHNEIVKRNNLIIDFRNNGGGLRKVTNLLFPYVTNGKWTYFGARNRNTNDIRVLYNKLYINEKDSSEKERFLLINHNLKTNPNYFITLTEEIFETDTFYKLPKKVYIMLNRKSVSMPEVFTMSVKISSKVIVVGEESAGALIYTDAKKYKLPCTLFNVLIPTFESELLDKYGKRDLPVKPDLELNLPQKDWISKILSFKE